MPISQTGNPIPYNLEYFEPMPSGAYVMPAAAQIVHMTKEEYDRIMGPVDPATDPCIHFL